MTLLKASSYEDVLVHQDHKQKINHLLPLNDRVLVRRLHDFDDEKQVKIADAYQPESNRGEVLAIGDKAVGVLEKGDRVLFSHYGAQEIEVDGEELVLVSIHDIWLRL